MAYSQSLAARIRTALAGQRGIAEKKMFGGVGFLLHGNLLVGVWKTSLIVRVGPEIYDAMLAESHVCEFDITGKPMKGWVMVDADGLETDGQLSAWIDRAWQFVKTLPKK
jgi:hypothetical protein